jgi:hypothetical protein
MNRPEILSPVQTEQIMKRFPAFELSYESVSHKKVSNSYNTCFAIPQGKKCFAWFTFLGEEDVCFVFDLNRDKKIVKAYRYAVSFKQPLALGTVFYGTFLEEGKPFFVIEDTFQYKGIPMKNANLYQKLDFTKDALELISNETSQLMFALPMFWDLQETREFDPSTIIPAQIINNIGYITHHLQYRALYETVPYINVQLARPKLAPAPSAVRKNSDILISAITPDFAKPQYNYPTTFQVRADIQFDIYHLYAYGQTGEPAYYGVASVPNYKTSVFMNGLFRKIRENKNLDFIEESDDEEDFQDQSLDKYVDLEKKLVMECTFHKKFKKWVPMRVLDSRTRLVQVGKLARDHAQSNPRPNHNRPYQNNYRSAPHHKKMYA